MVNDTWRSGVGVFGGTAGIVTVTDTEALQGLRFTVDGYHLTGPGSLALSGDPYSTPNQSSVSVDEGLGTSIATPLSSSGAGLVKLGGGGLTLSGANSYTGLTTISAGTVALAGKGSIAASSSLANAGVFDISGLTNGGASVASLSGSGAVILGANTLTLTNAADVFAGVISGSGGVTLANGNETLSGTNSYTGPTIVQYGSPLGYGSTLTLVGAGSIAASSVVDLEKGALDISGVTGGATSIVSLSGTQANLILGDTTLTLTHAVGAFDGSITGAGGLTIAGGTEILNQGNYTGATTIRVGATLTLAGAAFIEQTSNVADAGTFDISGVTDGAVGVEGLTGTGVVKLGSNTLFLTNANGVFSGTLSGADGGFTVGGTETLTGVNTYTGATSVSGTLILTGAGSVATSSSFEIEGMLDLSQLTRGVVLSSLGGDGRVLIGANTVTLKNNGGFGGVISGTGGVTIASGVEVFAGAEAYTGVTTIAAGATLAIGGGGYAPYPSMSLEGSINASSDVVVLGTFDVSAPSYTIHGAGIFPVDSSIQSLSGDGQVVLGQDNLFLTNASGTFSGVITSQTGPDTIANPLFGSLGVESGTETLAGANTYYGETLINAGATLALAGTGSISTSSSVQDNGTFDISGVTDGGASVASLGGTGGVSLGANSLTLTKAGDTYSGTISGSGGLTLSRGAETLNGTNTYTGATLVDGGVLTLAGASPVLPSSPVVVNSGGTLALGSDQTLTELSGTGAVSLAAGTLTVGTDGATTTFSGPISGVGGLIKVGSGELVLDGASAYSGPTLIQSGILSVNGSISDSAVTVSSTGVLKGDGSLGALSVRGVVAPGDPIGRLNVMGDVALSPTSTYQVNVNAAGAADLIAAAGKAQLGGKLNVIAAPGAYNRLTLYPILTAAGGVSGAFSIVTTNYAFLRPTVIYAADTVELALVNSNLPFQSAASTLNQRAAASAAYALGPASPLYDALSLQTDQSAPSAFDAISGEIYADTPAELMRESRYVRDAVLDRLNEADEAVAAGQAATTRFGGSADITGWGQLFGAFAQSASRGGGEVASTFANTAGAIVGVDARLPPVLGRAWRAGLGVGCTDTPLSSDARGSRQDIDSTHLVGYAGGSLIGGLQARFGVDYDWSSLAAHRAVTFPSFAEGESSISDARTADLFGEVGYSFRLGRLNAEPFANAAYVHVGLDPAHETGGAAKLEIAEDVLDGVLTQEGVRLSAAWPIDEATTFSPYAVLSEVHTFGDRGASALVSFAAGGPSFLIQGTALDPDAGKLEAGATAFVGSRLSFTAAYDGQISSRWLDQSFVVRTTYIF